MDKLHLGTQKPVDIVKLIDEFSDHPESKLNDSIYKNGLSFNIRGKSSIAIKWMPREHASNASPYAIQFNPNKMAEVGFHFEKLKKILSKVTDVGELEIKRVDHAVNLKESTERVWETLRVPYKRKLKTRGERYGDDYNSKQFTGGYIGDCPEMICIYNKAYEMRCKTTKLLAKDLREPENTRVEVRQWKKKIKYKRFINIPHYLDENVFKGIKRIELVDQDGLTKKQKRKHDILSTYVEDHGFNFATKILNKQGHFKRDYGKLIIEQDYSETLAQLYREKLRQFIKSEDILTSYKYAQGRQAPLNLSLAC